jgi:hypothetical protein
LGHFSGVNIPGNPGRYPNVVASAIGLALGIAYADILSKALLAPFQTPNDRFIELGNIGSSLATLVNDYQDNILNMVEIIQGNSTLFIAMCSFGVFSQRVTTSLTDQSYLLYQDLQLFILSQAFQASGFVSARSTGVNALDVAKYTSNVACPALSQAGNCNQWWIDLDNGNTYALNNPNDPGNDQINLTNTIVNKGWANLSDVFKVETCSGQSITFDTTILGVNCLVRFGFALLHFYSCELLEEI